jgi:hypothetical protein
VKGYCTVGGFNFILFGNFNRNHTFYCLLFFAFAKSAKNQLWVSRKAQFHVDSKFVGAGFKKLLLKVKSKTLFPSFSV